MAGQELGAMAALSFPMSASSGAGNTMACTAALAALDVVRSERLSERAAAMGLRLETALKETVERFPGELKITGAGLLLGLHLPDSRMAIRVVRGCIQRGVLVMTAFCNRSCILIEPPLTINESQIDRVAEAVIEAVTTDGFSENHRKRMAPHRA